jgi:uncharacterized protein YceK
MAQGAIHLMANPKKLIAVILLTFLTGCSSFSMLLSGGSFAVSQNTYAKIYNAADMLTMMNTQKGIKTHAYEKGKKYIYDNTIGLIYEH